MSPPYETPEATAVLRFAEEPDAVVSVKCWSDEYWGEPAACSEEAAFDGGALALKAGAYIYEITAVWNAENGYGGTASYFFYIKMTE